MMTVKDLIEKLSELDPDALVLVHGDEEFETATSAERIDVSRRTGGLHFGGDYAEANRRSSKGPIFSAVVVR
jgi:type IV secretory pathway VirJ component